MEESKLVRGLSRWDLTAITINTIIGAGIFGLPSKVTALIGSYSLFAFLACAVIVGFIVLCYAEVASRFQATGGMFLYAKEAFGPLYGFEVGWLYWIVRVTTFAANCNLLISYLEFFVPWINYLLLRYFGFSIPSPNEGFLRIALISLVLLIITVVNFIGVRESAVMTNIFTVGKIVPLVIFAAVGLFFIEPANFSLTAVPDYDTFSSAVLLLIYAFVGFEAAVIPAGETKDPQKNVPFALLTALGIVAVLYILIQIVSIGTLPELAKSEKPLADAAANFLGSFGAAFITVGALISIFGNLNGGFLSASRIPFAMAEQKELPQVLGKTHKKFKTPHVSLILTAVITLIFTIQSSFLTALTISTITRLIVYATTCLALPVFRQRTDLPKAQFKVPFDVLASMLSMILTIWLISKVDFKKEGLVLLIAAALGLVIYFAYRYFGKRNFEASSEKQGIQNEDTKKTESEI